MAETASGCGRVVLVTGEPGIGKSRFADAVAAQAEAAGLPSGTGTWEAEGCPPFWGWSQALRPLTGASETLLRPGGEQDAASTAFRLAGEIIGALASCGACLVLDDVQWADPDSHRLLGRVAHLVGSVPVLLVVCCREPLADATLETQASLATVARTDPVRVALSGLDTAEVADLVRARTGLQMGDALAHRVRDRTDGNPFLINATDAPPGARPGRCGARTPKLRPPRRPRRAAGRALPAGRPGSRPVGMDLRRPSRKAGLRARLARRGRPAPGFGR